MRPFKYNPNNNGGSFRHRISFLKPIIIKDALGQETRTFENAEEFTQAWAMIKTLKGSEYVAAASPQSSITYRFIIRYMAGLAVDMAIKYGDRLFDIIEPPINDDELNKTLTIIAKERV